VEEEGKRTMGVRRRRRRRRSLRNRRRAVLRMSKLQ